MDSSNRGVQRLYIMTVDVPEQVGDAVNDNDDIIDVPEVCHIGPHVNDPAVGSRSGEL